MFLLIRLSKPHVQFLFVSTGAYNPVSFNVCINAHHLAAHYWFEVLPSPLRDLLPQNIIGILDTCAHAGRTRGI